MLRRLAGGAIVGGMVPRVLMELGYTRCPSYGMLRMGAFWGPQRRLCIGGPGISRLGGVQDLSD